MEKVSTFGRIKINIREVSRKVKSTDSVLGNKKESCTLVSSKIISGKGSG